MEPCATEAAERFLAHYQATGGYLREAVDILCQLSTQPALELAEAGSRVLFSRLVEPLGNAFTPAACALYERLFAQVIHYCRGLPQMSALDRALSRFGLHTEADLLRRAESNRQGAPKRSHAKNAKKGAGSMK